MITDIFTEWEHEKQAGKKTEFENIQSLSDFELVQYIQNGLMSRATGGAFDNDFYQFIRAKILKNSSFSSLIPEFVKTCRDVEHFWSFIKVKFGSYAERREYLWSEFTRLLEYIENHAITPIDTLIVFDEAHIHEQWQKAIDRKVSDPEGAITMARTLLESILKHILNEQNISYGDNIELSELYKEVAKSLNLAPEQHQEQIFKQILGGANGIVSGLGAMRNKLGDAHGTVKSAIKPKERHSELAVNLAGSMAIFLYKTYKESGD